MTRLEVQIATHGADGLTPVLNRRYPAVDDVLYRVGWQGGCSCDVSDNMIVDGNTARSLTENRNRLLDCSDAEIILFSDNDISYTSEQILNLIDCFESNPDIEFICFKLDRDDKNYPLEMFDVAEPQRGYFPSSCEIAVRKSFINKYNIRFDTRFGLGARYVCFEEMVFVNSLLKKGARGVYLPVVIGRHESRFSTGTRLELKHKVDIARGAAYALILPVSAPLRLAVQAIRSCSISHLIDGLKGYFNVLFRPNQRDI